MHVDKEWNFTSSFLDRKAQSSCCLLHSDKAQFYLCFVVRGRIRSTIFSKLDLRSGFLWTQVRRFVKHYGLIAKPLTELLKKGNFIWTPNADTAFSELKAAITSAPVLALPNFDEEFFIETDASGQGIGAVLTQNRHPVAFLSTTLSPKNQSLSTYEKEMFAVLIPAITRACHSYSEASVIIATLENNETTKKWFSLLDGRLLYKNRIFVPQSSDWRCKILYEFHSTLAAGHSGFLRTYTHLARSFAWPGMRRDVKRYVASCDQCQRNNYESIHPPGLLQPLPIPENIWVDIVMDFIDGLPPSDGKTSILVVVDRLSKYGHFVAVTHPYSAAQIAEVFTKEIFRLHGMPRSIVNDRDKIFISNF
ncbi:uncharacterized protein LOC133720775 [Rosa rugosa]|uniref:uncharacterized protein LOC133720775 n=1 Tax=Rosa rugosa TaxID=74645 RepID=UPI002B417E89|nr:uncharacterized protein LOC133720775 [Rosa rugosa]